MIVITLLFSISQSPSTKLTPRQIISLSTTQFIQWFTPLHRPLDRHCQHTISLGDQCRHPSVPRSIQSSIFVIIICIMTLIDTSCGSTSTMQIINRIQWKIKHDDMIHLRYIQSARCYIGTYQHTRQHPIHVLLLLLLLVVVVVVVTTTTARSGTGRTKPSQILVPRRTVQITVIPQTLDPGLRQRVLRRSAAGHRVAEYQGEGFARIAVLLVSREQRRSSSAARVHGIDEQT
mmetsp:Transcript_51872/g.76875  ORF Transcript_51872/g.76875 Transcript_51872/m.76875 type:complete len:233 (-) Transcript_51872:1504-2202(-)